MDLPADTFSIEERIAMATRCTDADCVAKVADAGNVFTDAHGVRFQIMHNGLRVVEGGYYGKWMTDLIRLCRGHHEVQEERMFHEVVSRLPNDATIIELGGYWSYYSLWFLQDAPLRRAFVVEPDPAHLHVGRRNAQLNGLTPTFFNGFASAEYVSLAPFSTEESGVVEMPGYSVPWLMNDKGIERLDLLHLDIQGAETAVLNSCRDLFLRKRVDWVFVSTHAHQISGDPLTHQRCLTLLRDCGAIIEVEHDVHESFSGDGLIVARFCAPPSDWRPIELSYNRQSQSLFRHLAYDLAEAWRELDALRSGTDQEVAACHPN